MTSSHVQLEVDDHVAVVRLNRPEALNALTGAMAAEIATTFRGVGQDEGVWVVVLSAAGERAFCVGADLKERAGFTLKDFYANREHIKSMFAAVRQTPQPTIAAIFGFALGGGFELALSCDVIVAEQETQLGLPEPRVGLLPAGGGTQLLARRVGVGRAKDMIFGARRVDAGQALEWGIVSDVAETGQAEGRAVAKARQMCGQSPVALREVKRAVDHGFGLDIDEAVSGVEDSAWKTVIETEDRAEGIEAFNAKREPRWRNR